MDTQYARGCVEAVIDGSILDGAISMCQQNWKDWTCRPNEGLKKLSIILEWMYLDQDRYLSYKTTLHQNYPLELWEYKPKLSEREIFQLMKNYPAAFCFESGPELEFGQECDIPRPNQNPFTMGYDQQRAKQLDFPKQDNFSEWEMEALSFMYTKLFKYKDEDNFLALFLEAFEKFRHERKWTELRMNRPKWDEFLVAGYIRQFVCDVFKPKMCRDGVFPYYT